MPETTGIQRHKLDTFALTLGLLCLTGSGLALAARADLFDVDGLVVLAAVWLVVGLVGVTRVLHHLMSGQARREVRDQLSSD
jgi:hypothetical protein